MKMPLALLSSVVLTLGIAIPFAQAASFKDVSQSYRFHDDIDYLSDIGIVSGFPDGRFMPDAQVSRVQAAIMIGRAFDVDGTKRSTVFDDISPSSVASGYIAQAVEGGIVSGFPDGTFRPNEPVTRGRNESVLDHNTCAFQDLDTHTFLQAVHINLLFLKDPLTFDPNALKIPLLKLP
ncbi:S-layer homology domain-containing protein [Domibacillus sp. PGB-M46]|uniref:S-layer homology domain-containing protein n=1 Tax=Domibacillus sp. PGB-M46 TaxID=2910255 RepID=UPI001F582C92|nr:S-layer homology domain-containing protein [Domibacillus sp. PGB-M46]MCI2254211.1 S-layer homology domain-containing protein [Domibacillus sp. PGB-M46]